VNVSLKRLEGLFLTEEKIFLSNPPLEQSFDQLEDEHFKVLHCCVLLDEEKIGGETVVSLLKFMGFMVLWLCCCHNSGTPQIYAATYNWYYGFLNLFLILPFVYNRLFMRNNRLFYWCCAFSFVF